MSSMFDNLLQGIKDLFVPEPEYLNEKIGKVKGKLGFVNSVIETGEAIGGVFSSSTYATRAPSLELELDIKGTKKDVTIIDLSWYTPYKPYGDAVLSGILWIGFAWSIYINIPNIIGGGSSSMVTVMQLDRSMSATDDIKGGMKRR